MRKVHRAPRAAARSAWAFHEIVGRCSGEDAPAGRLYGARDRSILRNRVCQTPGRDVPLARLSCSLARRSGSAQSPLVGRRDYVATARQFAAVFGKTPQRGVSTGRQTDRILRSRVCQTPGRDVPLARLSCTLGRQIHVEGRPPFPRPLERRAAGASLLRPSPTGPRRGPPT